MACSNLHNYYCGDFSHFIPYFLNIFFTSSFFATKSKFFYYNCFDFILYKPKRSAVL